MQAIAKFIRSLRRPVVKVAHVGDVLVVNGAVYRVEPNKLQQLPVNRRS